jgi:hypothetical protein
MSKISKDAAKAFLNNRKFKRSNTEVKVFENKSYLYLFGNNIAIRENNETFINHCNWITRTTQSRLLALGARIRKCKDIFVFNEQFKMEKIWYKI